jgi:solute carrier family 25 protein 34/35
VLTTSIQVVKTRLQLQGELTRSNSNYVKPYRNIFQAFYVIVKNEGVRGIQKGLGKKVFGINSLISFK